MTETKLTREERVNKIVELTGMSRCEAELHVDMKDGKVRNPHWLPPRKKSPGRAR